MHFSAPQERPRERLAADSAQSGGNPPLPGPIPCPWEPVGDCGCRRRAWSGRESASPELRWALRFGPVQSVQSSFCTVPGNILYESCLCTLGTLGTVNRYIYRALCLFFVLSHLLSLYGAVFAKKRTDCTDCDNTLIFNGLCRYSRIFESVPTVPTVPGGEFSARSHPFAPALRYNRHQQAATAHPCRISSTPHAAHPARSLEGYM